MSDTSNKEEQSSWFEKILLVGAIMLLLHASGIARAGIQRQTTQNEAQHYSMDGGSTEVSETARKRAVSGTTTQIYGPPPQTCENINNADKNNYKSLFSLGTALATQLQTNREKVN